ncbi:MAG: PEP-CTERM sorting domain-containing protein [Acidobacteriota bacterium]
MRSVIRATLLMVLSFAVFGGQAQALTTSVFDIILLDQRDTLGGTGTEATVDITYNDVTGVVTFFIENTTAASVTSPGDQLHAFGFNLPSDLTVASFLATATGWSTGTSENFNGYGTYDVATFTPPNVEGVGGTLGIPRLGSFNFQVDLDGNVGAYSAADFLTFLPTGASEEAGALAARFRQSSWNTNTPGTPDTPTVPEPSSLILLGSGLLGMAGFIRRKILK